MRGEEGLAEGEHSLVVAGGGRVVEVAVGVDSGESAQTQPAEVLLTGGAGHLVASVHLLQGGQTAQRSDRNKNSSILMHS